MPSPQKKYTTLVSNTLLFAISNFSSKLLSFFIRPYLSYALDSPDVMGVSSLLQQATNLLIPVVSLGVAYAVIRFGLDKATNKSSVFVNGAATLGLGFVVLLLAMPLVLVALLAGVVGVLWGIGVGIFRGCRCGIWPAGAGTVLTVLALLLTAGYNHTAYYPSLTDLQSSLTIYNSSSSRFTLYVMAIVSILVPFVAGYIWYVWRAMGRKRISEQELQEEGDHLY